MRSRKLLGAMRRRRVRRGGSGRGGHTTAARPVITVLAVVGLLVPLLGWTPSQAGGAAPVASAAEGDKIAPGLERKFERSGGEPRDFWVSFDQTADTSGAREIEDWAERGQYVVDKLQETAKQSQADTIAMLDDIGADYEAYWISNAIRIESGDYALAHQLAAEPAVERVFAPVKYEQPDPIKQRIVGSRMGSNADGVVEWGVKNIKADQVWDQYGVRGDGIVVANVDSGVQFDHPALVESYRGNNGDGTFSNDYNWFDPTGQSDFPSDGNGHGTHTMGTMVGDDGGANQIGVAPGATWIAARGCEGRTCSDTSLLAASQWVLAPTKVDGTAADPAMRPNIVNNSWGTDPSNDPFMEDIQQAWADAGMMGVWSNGNSGEFGCETSGSPGSRTLNYSVGAYDNTDTIAYFSSRGPGQDGEVKPNISAPGVDVRSSWIGNQYSAESGTSMAAPHVAGAVALLWSADPSLVGDIDGTRQLLDDSAIDTPDDQCGGTPDDNNVYGEGRLDALALVDITGETGTITGTVTHDGSGDPVAGATIQLVAGDVVRSTRTGDTGGYSTNVPAGDYQATVSGFGYESKTVPISVIAGQTTTTDIELAAAEGFTVSGTVVDKRTGRGIPGTTVTVAGTRFAATTDNTGEFAVEDVPGPARYLITVDPPGACSKAVRRSVLVDGDITLQLKLARYTDRVTTGPYSGPPYGYSCVVEPTEWLGGTTPVEVPADGTPFEVGLPFTFTYFGEQYETILVNKFPQATFDADMVHSATLNVFSDNLYDPEPEARLTGVTGTKPNRAFTVEWRNLSSPIAPGTISVALTLHENGDIVYAYKDLDPTKPWQLGNHAVASMTDHSPNGHASSRTQLIYSIRQPVLSSDRQIRFELPPNGFVAGRVVDRATGKPVADASVDLFNKHGTRLVRKTTDADGTYRVQLMTGRPYSIGVVKSPAYQAPPRERIELTDDREVRRLTTILHGGRIQLSDDEITLRRGETDRIRLNNRGDRQLIWWATTHEAGSTPSPGSELDSVELSDLPSGWSTSLTPADDTWWLAGQNPRTLIGLDRGHPTGAEIDLDSVAQQLGWPSDLLSTSIQQANGAWLPDRGLLCMFPSNRVADTIVCVDPETSQVRAEIPTGYKNEGTTRFQAKGLAYDPDLDLFYVTFSDYYDQRSTWLRTLDGLDHPEPGVVRHTCQLPDDSSGLAYNPASHTLWYVTEEVFDNNPEIPLELRQIEPQDCHVLSDLPIVSPLAVRPFLRPGGIDEDGNFLVPYMYPSGFGPTSTISTMQTSDPAADPVPWLQVSTDSGTLDPRRSQEIRVSVDWDAVPEGVTGAKLVFRGNGGANSKVTVPIRLTETNATPSKAANAS